MLSFDSQSNFHVGRYLIIKRIEEGSQAIVYLAFYEGKFFCIKAYRNDYYAVASFKKQSEMLQSISHNYLIKPLEICASENCKLLEYDSSRISCIIMQYHKNGDLRNYLKHSPFPRPICRRIFLFLLEAFQYLRNRKIIHRDLKPQNILVTSNYQLKLIDLGLAIHSQQVASEIVGSKPFIAPESLKYKKYSHQSDLFALGVIYFTLVTGTYPFREAKITDSKYFLFLQHKNIKFWQKVRINKQEVDQQFKAFINKILHPQPEMRPTIEQIFQMEEMQGQVSNKEDLKLFFHNTIHQPSNFSSNLL